MDGHDVILLFPAPFLLKTVSLIEGTTTNGSD